MPPVVAFQSDLYSAPEEYALYLRAFTESVIFLIIALEGITKSHSNGCEESKESSKPNGKNWVTCLK